MEEIDYICLKRSYETFKSLYTSFLPKEHWLILVNFYRLVFIKKYARSFVHICMHLHIYVYI